MAANDIRAMKVIAMCGIGVGVGIGSLYAFSIKAELGCWIDELAVSASMLMQRATGFSWLGKRMLGQVIDGKAIAASVRAEIKTRIQAMSKEKSGFAPGLAVVIVGTRKDSQTYVRMKVKMCQEVGIESFHHELEENVSEDEVVQLVKKLNNNGRVHGILVQLPLPKHISEKAVLGAISIEKDVDGFHPLNIGRLAMKGRAPLFTPCTPVGCIELLKREGVKLDGANCVVVGRSNIVGMPAALLLIRENATVTIVHSRTKQNDMLMHLKRADVVIAAAGMAGMVKAGMLKRGCVVIDVGTNAVDDSTKKAGYRLVGDVEYARARYVSTCRICCFS